MTTRETPDITASPERQLRDVDVDGYRLRTWDANRSDPLGKSVVGYELTRPDGRVLFRAEDFACSPLRAIDSDECVRAILTFLTLRPGDTDASYFEGYTAEQMDFARSDAERLSLWCYAEHTPPFRDWPGPSTTREAVAKTLEAGEPESDPMNTAANFNTPTRTKIEAREGMYACPECGCADIEGTAWIHLNTGGVTGDEPPNDDYWCPACMEHYGRVAILDKDGNDGDEHYEPFTLDYDEPADAGVCPACAAGEAPSSPDHQTDRALENGEAPAVPPRIYVACLKSYNNGELHGRWIRADQDAAAIQAEIAAMLAESPEEDAEEWAIHDDDNWHGLHPHEYESIDDVAAAGVMLAKHGPLFAKVLEHLGGGLDHTGEACAALDERYQGAYEDLAEWAGEHLEESGELARVPEALRPHIDFEGYAEAAEENSEIFTVEFGGQVHVFLAQ